MRFLVPVQPSGALSPAQILDSALSQLVIKMQTVVDECGRMAQSGSGAMAGMQQPLARSTGAVMGALNGQPQV